MKELTHLAIRMKSVSEQLTGHELVLSDEGVSHINVASEDILQMLHNLTREAVTSDISPLLDREIRHDIRNRLAAVKGFADVMQMDLVEGHVTKPVLQEISGLGGRFDQVLDEVKEAASEPSRDGVQDGLAMPS